MNALKGLLFVILLALLGITAYSAFSGYNFFSLDNLSYEDSNKVTAQPVKSYIVANKTLVFDLPTGTKGIVVNGVNNIFNTYGLTLPPTVKFKTNTQISISYTFEKVEAEEDESKITEINEIFFDGVIVWRNSANQQYPIKIKIMNKTIKELKQEIEKQEMKQ